MVTAISEHVTASTERSRVVGHRYYAKQKLVSEIKQIHLKWA